MTVCEPSASGPGTGHGLVQVVAGAPSREHWCETVEMSRGLRPKRDRRAAALGRMRSNFYNPAATDWHVQYLTDDMFDRVVEIGFEKQTLERRETKPENRACARSAIADYTEMRIVCFRDRPVDGSVSAFNQLPRGCDMHAVIPGYPREGRCGPNETSAAHRNNFLKSEGSADCEPHRSGL